MTCIVGVERDGMAYLGADSMSTDANSGRYMLARGQKMFRKGPFVIGTTGERRINQLLRYSLQVPDRTQSHMEFMATTFMDAVRQCLKDGGAAAKDHEQESGGEMLVAYDGRIYHIWPNYQISHDDSGFYAIGSARDAAMGAMRNSLSDDPFEICKQGLIVAEMLNAFVRRPFTFERSPG